MPKPVFIGQVKLTTRYQCLLSPMEAKRRFSHRPDAGIKQIIVIGFVTSSTASIVAIMDLDHPNAISGLFAGIAEAKEVNEDGSSRL